MRARETLLLVVMTTAPEGVILTVGHVVLESIPSARVSPGENPVHLLDKRQRRLWCRYLVEGVVGGDTSWPVAEGLPLVGRGGSVQVANLKGAAELMRRRSNPC